MIDDLKTLNRYSIRYFQLGIRHQLYPLFLVSNKPPPGSVIRPVNDLKLAPAISKGCFSKWDFSTAAVLWLIAIASKVTITFLSLAPRMLRSMRTNYMAAALMDDPIAAQTIYQVTWRGHTWPSNYRTLSSRLFFIFSNSMRHFLFLVVLFVFFALLSFFFFRTR